MTRSSQKTVLVVVLMMAVAGYLLLRNRSPEEMRPRLLEAIRYSELAAVEDYLRQGGSPEATVDVYGEQMTLLKAAIIDREEAIALALLDAGAQLESSGVDLTYVGTNGMKGIVERLLPLRQDRAIEHTGVASAADNGYYDVVEVYIRRRDGRSSEWRKEFGRAANSALFARYDDTARLLVEAGADLKEALHTAARFSSPGMVRYLLAQGMNPNERIVIPGVLEQTPIEFAWLRYREEEASDEPGAEGARPRRIRSDAAYVLFELTRAGARLDSVDLTTIAKDGLAEITAADGISEELLVTARIGLADHVEGLLLNRSQLDQSSLRSAVIVALQNDHDDIARILLGAGAPFDGGVLHAAAAGSSPGMVRYLLSLGASPSERVDGKSVLDFWLEESTTNDPEFILHELITAGTDACELVSRKDRLPGLSAMVLKDSAPKCWDNVEQ